MHQGKKQQKHEKSDSCASHRGPLGLENNKTRTLRVVIQNRRHKAFFERFWKHIVWLDAQQGSRLRGKIKKRSNDEV
jgi:hypothetical protein